MGMLMGDLQIVKKVELEAQRKPGRGRKRNPIEDLRREVAIMRTLRHKNIVSLQEVVDDPSGNKMLLVMDYMEGGPVMTREALERGRCIPEPLALQYFRDMCKVGLVASSNLPHWHRSRSFACRVSVGQDLIR
jgi:calcium/calmodulin-dependent protein kinase kinase 2